jgi:hypothetical protein
VREPEVFLDGAEWLGWFVTASVTDRALDRGED